MRVVTYLGFAGDCAAAFAFYEQALGGTITMQMTYGQSPMAGDMPADRRDRIMHVRLVAGSAELMGSDAPHDTPTARQGFHVSAMTSDVAEAHRVFAALAEGGTVQMPLDATFWSPAFGMLVDRFGTPWMVNCEAAV